MICQVMGGIIAYSLDFLNNAYIQTRSFKPHATVIFDEQNGRFINVKDSDEKIFSGTVK